MLKDGRRGGGTKQRGNEDVTNRKTRGYVLNEVRTIISVQLCKNNSGREKSRMRVMGKERREKEKMGKERMRKKGWGKRRSWKDVNPFACNRRLAIRL